MLTPALRATLRDAAVAARLLADDLAPVQWCGGDADNLRRMASWMDTRNATTIDARNVARYLWRILKCDPMTARIESLELGVDHLEAPEGTRIALAAVVVSLRELRLDTEPLARDIPPQAIAQLREDAAQLEAAVRFIPLADLQRRILDALDGRSMTADELMNHLNIGSRSTLYGRNGDGGGLNELLAEGLVAKGGRKMRGYYRPDSPPRPDSAGR